MLVLADIRCLQDADYAGRGVGSHAQFILRALRSHGGQKVHIVGLIDPDIGPLAADHAALCDVIRTTFRSHAEERPAVFLQLSPMTHDTRPVAALLERPGVISATVVYDFIPLEFSRRYLADRGTRAAYAAAYQWLPTYEHFLPISAAAADETAQRLNIPTNRLTVTGVALRPVFEDKLAEKATNDTTRGNNDALRILFVGGGDPRKNLETVADAFGKLSGRSPRPILEIVGNYPKAIRRRIMARSPAAAAMIFHDRLSDEELADCYTRATLTVVASRAEGFSMPVIEAMACGCPVIASDIPAHRELVTNSAARFDAGDVSGLAELIGQLLADPAARAVVCAEQQPVAERFTAAAVGDRTWRAIEAATGRHQPRPAPAVPRIAFVTPFPPDRSGVADYSRETVRALARQVEVDVYTDQPDPLPTSEVRRFYPISAAPWLRPDYDAVVAVIGNSHFHTKIFHWHCRYGGACIVHDNRLIDLLAFWKGMDHVGQLASRGLDRPVAEAEISSWISDPAKLPLMFFDELLPKADPLIVHSQGIRANLKRLTGHQADYLPFCVYRQIPGKGDVDSGSRAVLGIDDDRLVIATFGSVVENKRPDVCIAAVGHLRQKGIDAHLYFVGSCDQNQRNRLSAQAAQVAAEDAVHFSGDWADEDAYQSFLTAADIGIQLRGHFFGGLSGALLDCIAAGLPTVANRDLAEAVETPDFVARVSDHPTGCEVATAIEHLRTIQRNDPRHTAVRDRYMAKHSFERYADGLLDLLKLIPTKGRPETDRPILAGHG